MTTFVERLSSLREQSPRKVAIRLQTAGRPDRVLTYEEMLRGASAYASALLREQIQPGEVVILILQHKEDEKTKARATHAIWNIYFSAALKRQPRAFQDAWKLRFMQP